MGRGKGGGVKTLDPRRNVGEEKREEHQTPLWGKETGEVGGREPKRPRDPFPCGTGPGWDSSDPRPIPLRPLRHPGVGWGLDPRGREG